ncbi:riboflavin transporter FmnP [Vulcanibacillus modesticaldus]|uniref:Riboflavin transporter n=1 Tax=Vulcanibacillus modesticaldus TaxID=337097 RepID=A0A1D2YSX9_9BACI|nr:ECF transporter S component [Vulcanibacillus modesticaldus]OEF98804.1 riboflavin transporter FmnP [Vulcanibacillus modesticaldus]
MKRKKSLNQAILISVMSAIAFIIQYFDFPLPFMPPFLKIDFSEIPALLIAIMFGPSAGIMVEFLKNTLHFIIKGSETGIPIGQMANFLAGTILILGTTLVYKKKSTKGGLILGLILGSISMAIVMSIANYYLILPFYEKMLNYSTTASEKLILIISGIGPFNIIKGIIITTLMVPIYSSLKPRLKIN